MSVFETLPADARAWLIAHGRRIGWLASRGDPPARRLIERYAEAQRTGEIRWLLAAIEAAEITIDKAEKTGT